LEFFDLKSKQKGYTERTSSRRHDFEAAGLGIMTNAWLGTSVPYNADLHPCSLGARADLSIPRTFELYIISVWQLLDAKLARRGSLEQEFERRVVHPALSCL